MKKIILCINDNMVLTLTAIALGVLVGIGTSATGWFAALAGVVNGTGILVLENLRRAYNHTWRDDHGKRWAMLSGMGVSVSAVVAGWTSIVINPLEALGVFASIAAILITLATAWSLIQLAGDKYNPRDGKVNLIIWAAFLGIIMLMETGCHALILWMTGTKATDLLHHDGIIFSGSIGLVLIAIFAIIYIILLIGYLWEKTVEWAKK